MDWIDFNYNCSLAVVGFGLALGLAMDWIDFNYVPLLLLESVAADIRMQWNSWLSPSQWERESISHKYKWHHTFTRNHIWWWREGLSHRTQQTTLCRPTTHVLTPHHIIIDRWYLAHSTLENPTTSAQCSVYFVKSSQTSFHKNSTALISQVPQLPWSGLGIPQWGSWLCTG